MVETLQNLQHVYSKWESRNPWLPGDGPRPSVPGNSQPASKTHDTSYNDAMQKGRQAWKTKFSTSGPPPQKRNHHSNKGPLGSMSSVSNSNVAHFKREPTVVPNVGRRRPFQGRCCSCMPNSRRQLYSDSVRDAGLHNIFNVETKSEEKDWFTRTYYVVSFVIQRKCVYHYPDVSLAVLTSPRLVEAAHRTLDDNGIPMDSPEKVLKKAQKKFQKEAKSLLKRMAARISNRLIRLTGWFLHRSLGFLLSSLLVHKGEIRMLQEASKKDAPLIYLPTHRSHLDYMLITFILFNYDMKAPHVAAGDNLLIPIFGGLLRGLGGYFIRRKLDKTGKKDHMYRALLQTYMEELLKKNSSFEFFIEGGRTRSGKALYPKGGLLSVLADACQEGVIDDAQIVPVSISYDKLIDGPFTSEQMGERKQKETFWRTCVAIYQMFMAKYGHVRVDFAQPFSLKEYLKEAAQNNKGGHVQYLGESPIAGPETPFSNTDKIKISPSETSLVSGSATDEQRRTIQGLADHVVYNQIAQQPIMSTQLLAFSLLFRHRQGVTFTDLVTDIDQMRDEIMNRGRDIGFTGHSKDVVEHARSLLGDKLVMKKTNSNSTSDELELVPNLSLPDVFALSYYGNVVTSVFAIESVIANQICAMCDMDLESLPCHDTLIISKEDLVESSIDLCEMFKYEFIFGPPCVSLETVVEGGFDQFTTAEILVREESDDSQYRDSQEKAWSQRVAASFTANDEDSDEENYPAPETLYYICQEDYSLEKLKFLRTVMGPIFESYFITACKLVTLLKSDIPEDEFCASVHAVLKERVHSGIASYSESASLDTLKNAIKGFQHIHVIECYQVAGVKMTSLTQRFQAEDVLNEFVSKLESFR